jgi:hypothetical protein
VEQVDPPGRAAKRGGVREEPRGGADTGDASDPPGAVGGIHRNDIDRCPFAPEQEIQLEKLIGHAARRRGKRPDEPDP